MSERRAYVVVLLNIALLLVSLFCLAYSGSKVIKHASNLAAHFRMPEFIIGFLILGLGTALPDLFVTAIASLEGNADLVVGSIIGTNIVNMCLILGIVTLARGRLPLRDKTIIEDFGWIFFALIIPFFLLRDGVLNFAEGALLVLVYFMFLYNIEIEKGMFPKKRLDEKEHLSKNVLSLLVGIFGIVVFAKIVVDNASIVSLQFDIAQSYIGMTLVAFGMALPELTTELSAARAKRESLVWGDLIGSLVTNLSLVLGVAGILGPLRFDFAVFQLGYAFMAISFLMVFVFSRSGNALDKGEGMALILMYIVFLMIGSPMLSPS